MEARVGPNSGHRQGSFSRGTCTSHARTARRALSWWAPRSKIGDVAQTLDEDAVRAAAIEWVRRVTLDTRLSITRKQLAGDFSVGGVRLPLIDRGRGIRKPSGWEAALSITTAAPSSGGARPYDDVEGADGLHRYKLRRDDNGRSENHSLRMAMARAAPLIWFYGLEPGVFQAILPVYLVAEEADQDQFVLALTADQRSMIDQRTVMPGSPVEATLRRYLISETHRRLHQPVFASQVMLAYATSCAVCSLGHRELLDAAHIIPDSAPGGDPVVPNGLALCKIHHAAYDANVLGIRPDFTVEIHQRLLDEIDGPMLRYGLQEHHGRPLMRLPTRHADLPDTRRLERRYEDFRAA